MISGATSHPDRLVTHSFLLIQRRGSGEGGRRGISFTSFMRPEGNQSEVLKRLGFSYALH